MSRNKLGHFEPGICGNPRGRPRKRRRVDYNKARSDFFETAEKLVPFTENGKRKRIPLSIAIERQLAMKAATGDLRAIIEWQKIQRRYTVEYQNEQPAPAHRDESDPQRTGSHKNGGRADQKEWNECLGESRDRDGSRQQSRQIPLVVTKLHAPATLSPDSED